MKTLANINFKSKVVIAMSGGVDSSVAAALLRRAGFEVVGVFMKFWSTTTSGGGENRCCSLDSEVRARQVAEIIKIPFYVFNFEKEFKRKIVDYFLEEYKAGRTPNPCVVCNKEIKFGLLLKAALKIGADYIATGHYARIQKKFVNHSPYKYGLGPAPVNRGGGSQQIRYSLISAKDKNKDQSYFLWKLNQKQLARVLFPVGDLTRRQVENLAKKFKLPFSGVKKSMEICFVPKTIEDFLKKYIKMKSGRIVDEKENELGWHGGLPLYTIGQRKGINLPGGPFYVLDKDLKKNRLIVTKNGKGLLKKEIFIKDVNWISGKEPNLPIKVSVKIRYRTNSVSAKIYKLKIKNYKLFFAHSQRAVTPGQSAVFYNKDALLGGGVIL